MAKKNKREFEILFNKYKRYVYKICYQYTRSNEDALDLSQEVFVKVFKNINNLKTDNSLIPWIKKVTVNICINYKRNKKDALSIEAGEDGESIKETLRDKLNTENTVIARLTNEKLKYYINELPADIKMAVILRHIKGLSYKEIASTMQKPEGTIKTYIYKGRQTLMKNLKNDEILGV